MAGSRHLVSRREPSADLSHKYDTYVRPQGKEHPKALRRFWSAVERLLRWIGHDRLPAFVKAAISVAEPAGRISLRSEPCPVPVEECGSYTVMSANLWHDWPRFTNLEERLEAFAKLVQSERVDLVLLGSWHASQVSGRTSGWPNVSTWPTSIHARMVHRRSGSRRAWVFTAGFL